MRERTYPVGPGWWALLDVEIPQLYEIDPGLTGLDIKEKYNYCDVQFYPSEGAALDLLEDVVSSIRSQSATTCANCGGHREKVSQWHPWCERCRSASPDERRRIREGSYLREGEPADRAPARAFRLEDAVRAKGGCKHMDDRMEQFIKESERMDAIGFKLTPEERYHICDMGFFNGAIQGYMIRAMKVAGFQPDEIRRAVGGLGWALDELTAAEAEKETI